MNLQLRHPLPVIVNNRDLRVEFLLEDLVRLGATELHLIDNASTFPELVDWLSFAPAEIEDRQSGRSVPLTIHRWTNCGPRAACRLVQTLRRQWLRQGVEYYATTDSDLFLGTTGNAVLQDFVALHQWICQRRVWGNPERIRIGCALSLDSINDPDSHIRRAELPYWEPSRLILPVDCPAISPTDELYWAPIDTTLAVIRLDPGWNGNYAPAIRVAGLNRKACHAFHSPWHHSPFNRPPDYQWYLDHADPQGTVYTARYVQERK